MDDAYIWAYAERLHRDGTTYHQIVQSIVESAAPVDNESVKLISFLKEMQEPAYSVA
jgi:hypothetical protein